MSSNEIQNHVEAMAWVRNGPGPGEGVDITQLQYIRSQNGFEDILGVFGGAGQSPSVLLLLDRQYTRSETAVFGMCPTTGDAVALTAGPPAFVIYPTTTLAQMVLQPIDRRVILDPDFVIPTDALEAAEFWEKYDAIACTPQDVEGEPVWADFCVGVIRIPRKGGTTGFVIIEGGGG